MALDLPEQLCEYEKCRLPFKPKRRGQRSHSRKCRYAHHNSRKDETKCPVGGAVIKK